MKKMTALILILVLCSLCLFLVSCGETETSADETTTDAPVSTTPVPVITTKPEEARVKPEEVVVGKVRVQLLSDTLVRLEVAMSGNKFQDKPSFSVINRDEWHKVDYSVVEEGDKTVIKTANYHVVLPTTSANLTKAVITTPDGEELWHYETKTNSDVFLPSPSDELQSWYFTDNPRVIPSEYGYSLPEDGSFTANNGFVTDRMATDCFVFLPQGSYKTFMSDFIDLTGRSEMITLNLLGYWDSRYYEYSEATALKQIRDYQSKGYSIDVLVVDTDWRDASRGVGYEINTSLFPDMARFLERAHEMGVTVVFNDHPEPATGTDNLMDKDEIEYRSENLKLILSLGLDYWWYDRNWSVALKGIDPELSLYTTGMFAFQWITQEHYNSLAAEELDAYARRGLIMANVDGIWNGDMTDPTEVAAHRYTLQWTGDILTTAEALKKEFYNMIYGGAEMGIPYMSSDIGGHTGGDVSPEMYVRWMQYGALSTVCRVHCTKPFSRMPWLFGDTAESVTKEYVGMRYRLMPLFYALSRTNYDTGLPVMKRLDIEYPQYAEASRNDQYLLGDYILVAPIAGKTLDPFKTESLSIDGKNAFKVEYFRNNSLSGNPAYTGYTEQPNYDWTTNGPSELGGLSENFSARFTTSFTPDTDLIIGFFADDGVRCYVDGVKVVDGWSVYDTYLNTETLKAGKTYEIKIEYCELGGNAHLLCGTMPQLDDGRTVFIPDGVWMDVWTGKEYTGPDTIAVSHGLETSPIFVRQGAIVPLVSQAQNTFGIDWSKITLDVYPSVDYSAEATIYEDDYSTVAYKDGQFRTTKVTMDCADKILTLKIGATVGTYKDAPAFTDRAYTVHLHKRANFGDITKITVDGKEVTFKTYAKSKDSTPFIETGAALDADIVEFTVTTPLTKAVEVKVYYASASADGKNEEYDDSAVKFTMVANTITKSSMNNLNLTEKGDLDWALFGISNPDSVLYKKNGKGWIGVPESWDTNYGFSDNYTIRWSDGDEIPSGSSTNGPVSGRNFDVVLKTDGSKVTYTIYLGGYKSVSKITVRDRAGNVETLTFGNLTTNYYRQIVIECEAGEASELFVNYSLLSGDNMTFSAITASAK